MLKENAEYSGFFSKDLNWIQFKNYSGRTNSFKELLNLFSWKQFVKCTKAIIGTSKQKLNFLETISIECSLIVPLEITNLLV